MAIAWDSIRSLLLFLGPILLPKAISYYRNVRKASRLHGQPVKPVPPPAAVALGLLFFLASAYLVKTLPLFAPEDVFTLTQSRLQVPVDVLFNRLAAIRPGNVLTAGDTVLRAKFVNMESRLLYLQFGPEVLTDCPFCNSDEPKSYFYYALPALLWPHLANLIVLAIVTSSSWTRKYGAQWRTLATIAGASLCAAEVYLVSTYGYHANARALRLAEVDFFYWSMRNYRLISIAALDAALGWLIFLSATNRAFILMPSPAERIELANRAIMGVKSKINAVGIIKNTTLRDEELYARVQNYWHHEVRLMREVMEDREVIESVNDALGNRIAIQDMTRDADNYAVSVLAPLNEPDDDE